MHKTLQESLKIGWVVIIALAVLTAIEFVVAITLEDAVLITLLLIVAVAKGWLIAQYFMHFGQLWGHIAEAWEGMLHDPIDDIDDEKGED